MEKNNYTKKEVLQLMYQAFESGFKKYEVVDAGLESIETKEECGWILRRYDSDLEKEIQKETQKQLITEIMNEDAKDGLYKKQTAVEWLFHQLWDKPKDKFTWYAILKQAKEMDKKQREELIVFSKEMCTSYAHAEYIVNEFNKTYGKDA